MLTGGVVFRPLRRPGGAQIDFEKEIAVKAAEYAERLRRDEEELEESLRRRKEAAVANYSNIVQSTLTQVGGLYAVSQACLLSVFVPQKCPQVIPCYSPPQYTCNGLRMASLSAAGQAQAIADANVGTPESACCAHGLFEYPTFLADGHLCTMKENIDWLTFSEFNKAVFLVNVLTLFIMLLAQSFFWKREVWMINHLDENNEVPYSSLPEQIQPYEELEKTNKAYNATAYAYAQAVMFMVLCNFAISTYFLINGDGYYVYNIGSRTITGLLTNSMLVSTKVIGYFSYARLSKTHDWAISMFSVVPVSYNVVDENYQMHHGTGGTAYVKPEQAPL